MVALSFDDPGRGALIASLLVVLWLARPPRVQHRLPTAHLAAWRAALARVRRPRLRARPLRLWLMLAGMALAVAAASGPRLDPHEGPKVLVALLDTSASMGAREPEGDCALDRAKTRLAAVARTLPTEVELRVLLCDGNPRLLRGARRDVLAAIGEVRASATAAAPPLRELAARIATDPELAVWTLTDARGPAPLPEQGALSVFGSPRSDVGIVACEVHDAWPFPEVDIELDIATTGAASQPVCAVEGGMVERETPEVLPSGADRIRLRVHGRRVRGGEVRLVLQVGVDDALAADDAVVLDLPPPASTRVGVLRGADDEATDIVGEAAGFLAALGGGEVVRDAGVEVDLLICDGGRLASVPPRVLSFGTAFGAAVPGAPQGGPMRVIDWDRRDPLTAGLDLSELIVRRAVPAGDLPQDGRILVQGAEGPLLIAREQGRQRSLHAAFRLADSNLPRLAAFPQLLRRAFLFVAGPPSSRSVVGPLVAAAETDLRQQTPARDDRLPAFGGGADPLAVPVLLLAVLLLALRTWV
ncbi:MAG: VWA domain-containing protein [Planctomycetota bacterium]